MVALTRSWLSVVDASASRTDGLEGLGAGVEQGQVELELAGEVLVEDRLADAGLGGDGVHGRGVVARRDEDLAGGVQQLAAALGAAQPPPRRRGAGNGRSGRLRAAMAPEPTLR